MRYFNGKLKTVISNALIWGRVDRFFRFLNNKKLLVVMYHGITENHYTSPVWTQLPVRTFREQLEYLGSHYLIVTLADVTDALLGIKSLPNNSALITFDDGLKNNFTVAYPILKEMGLPATIFLTVDYIATQKLLWFDEMYLLIKQAVECGLQLPDFLGRPLDGTSGGKITDSCLAIIESFKHAGKERRLETLEKMREIIPFDNEKWSADFGLLDWDNIRDMQRSGLIDFGVHTSSHSILSELPENEWASEIVFPKEKLESLLATKISTFCFPNGRKNIDFGPEHIEYLRSAGYVCAFSTENALYSFRSSEPMAIGRIPAGNDCTSEPAYFRLNTSGVIQFTRACAQ